MHDAAQLVPTASQTVGPFFSIGLCPHNPSNLVPSNLEDGSVVVTIRGRVLDGDGHGVPDAVLEIWRAGGSGKYTGSEGGCDARGVPSGFSRILTSERGEFEFRTIKPGQITGENGEIYAPHLAVLVFMRGLLRHLMTRIYFPQEPANEKDSVLKAVLSERRETLIATPIDAKNNELQWNVLLQGEAETVFFEA